MGDIRVFSPHKRWRADEVELLFALYSTTPRRSLAEHFPGRSVSTIECKANSLGLYRVKKPARTKEEVREAKRAFMAQKRLKDPVAAREYQLKMYHANRDERLASMKKYQQKRFFWRRAVKLKGANPATAWELSKLWRKQKGLCALTGRKLDRSAQLDHIVAKARGGDDSLQNLRWLCKEANLALRELDDAEFISLCADCMRWIGLRIMKQQTPGLEDL